MSAVCGLGETAPGTATITLERDDLLLDCLVARQWHEDRGQLLADSPVGRGAACHLPYQIDAFADDRTRRLPGSTVAGRRSDQHLSPAPDPAATAATPAWRYAPRLAANPA